jgi:hypothetical protein
LPDIEKKALLFSHFLIKTNRMYAILHQRITEDTGNPWPRTLIRNKERNIMPSKGKEERLEQKAYWEGKLSQRLAQLKEDGVESGKTVKDTVVKQIRAKLRETNNRLETIDKMEKKIQEMAATKAEKLAAPKVKKSKKETAEEEAESKRQQKKKKKKAKKEKKAE